MKLEKEQVFKSTLIELPQFETTKECEPLQGIIGQERALQALEFGLKIDGKGFNIYVSGPPGIGKMSSVQSFIHEIAKEREVPPDWCYLYNFRDPYEPIAVKMPAGHGKEFSKEMRQLVGLLDKELPNAFSNEDYSSNREAKLGEIQKIRQNKINSINEYANEKGFIFEMTMMGPMIIPMKEGRAMSQEELQALSAKEQEKLKKKKEEIDAKLMEVQKEMRKLQKDELEQATEFDRQIALHIISGTINDLRDKFDGHGTVSQYLDDVQNDILENLQTFKMQFPQLDGGQPFQAEAMKQQIQLIRDDLKKKYLVNVVVDNGDIEGAPVVIELNPRYTNIVGRIEKELKMGVVTTDFTLIKAGALLKANGGFLIIPSEDLVKDYFSWEALKRSLQGGTIRIEELADQMGYMTLKTLRPQAIPLNVKVILIGVPYLYDMLQAAIPEFSELFKVKADFDTVMDKVDKNIQHFLGFVTNLSTNEHMLYLDQSGTRKILEHAMRLAEDKDKLSTQFGSIADIIREANFWAGNDGSKVITEKHIKTTLDKKEYRYNMMQQRIEELIDNKTLLIGTEGEVVGQVNGLAVIMHGDYMFGRPNRITATVYSGRKGVIDIERETKLGGPIHTKGVMIIGGYLGMKYAGERPLNLSASLVFEQSYSGVDGDSASQAELYALISALSDIPLSQSIAVTGSVNQHGEVQAIGGVNEKIEGYYSVCKKKGLNGRQGVLIPQSNIRNLILKDEIVDAVEKGLFSIWSVSTIDEGIEILTGKPAGERIEDGNYPEGSVNRKVVEKLELFNKLVEKTEQ